MLGLRLEVGRRVGDAALLLQTIPGCHALDWRWPWVMPNAIKQFKRK